MLSRFRSNKWSTGTSGVNLAGILGDADVDPEGLMRRGGERWGGVGLVEGSGED